jgi:hypothetical protein
MTPYPSEIDDIPEANGQGPYDGETPEEDLWFHPGPPEEEPDGPSPLPRAGADEHAQIAAFEQAQGEQAAHLGRVSARLGALDERLRRGPEGWRHRLALIEASELSWLTGSRVSADRLGL